MNVSVHATAPVYVYDALYVRARGLTCTCTHVLRVLDTHMLDEVYVLV